MCYMTKSIGVIGTNIALKSKTLGTWILITLFVTMPVSFSNKNWEGFFEFFRLFDLPHLVFDFSASCPSPMKNRDFVLQSSWLQTQKEYILINHSVHHHLYPPRRGFARALSYLTGFLIKPLGFKSCEVGYVTHVNPRGKIPSVLTNKVTSYVAPKMLRKIHKACINYPQWKSNHCPEQKYWLNPEQMVSPRINLSDVNDTFDFTL